MERKADRKAPWCEPSQPPCLTPRKTAPRVSAPALDHRPDRRPSPVPFVLKTVGPRCKLPTRALKIAPTVSLPQLPRPCRAVNYRHGPWFCERTFAWAHSLAACPPSLPLSLSLPRRVRTRTRRARPAPGYGTDLFLSFSLSPTCARPSHAHTPRSATEPNATEGHLHAASQRLAPSIPPNHARGVAPESTGRRPTNPQPTTQPYGEST